ncbi:PD-(D/E)XK motif protein [Actinomyces qiguomingii]|uniref:PD-(D/E)XK motif protein n=1 Tax=Actinomyces qiguomingii TaxID=2057800 RepID=UPI000CA00523|nr:PD-(D/E)XK motif protein [Actinomyces qiguomingii]
MDDHAGESNALTPETLAAYIDAGIPTEQRLADAPICILGIDPPRRELTLRTPATEADIDVSAYRMIRTDLFEEPGDETVWFRVTVDAEGVEYEAYSLLQSVADQLQQGDDMERALHVALDAYRGLLSRAPRLSEDQETGLFGELIALNRLIDGVGESRALAAWLGPQSEEHDFVLGDCDVEVKTTRSERRVHVIHGLGQLAPTPGRPLYLMSVQVTRAGASDSGATLPGMIERIRRRLRAGRIDFDDKLTEFGWEDARADRLYPTRLLLRSEPRFYAVDDDFPAITSAGLGRILSRPELVRSIDYRIDVTDLAPEEAPPVEFGAQVQEEPQP